MQEKTRTRNLNLKGSYWWAKISGTKRFLAKFGVIGVYAIVAMVYLGNGLGDSDGACGLLGKSLWGIFWDGSFWCRNWVWHQNGRMNISTRYNAFLRSRGFLGLGVMLEGGMLGRYLVLDIRVSSELLGVLWSKVSGSKSRLFLKGRFRSIR